MANSEDHNWTSRFATSDQSLHCLLRPVCPNTLGKYVGFISGTKT